VTFMNQLFSGCSSMKKLIFVSPVCAVVSHYSVFRLGTSGFCSAGLSTRACALLCLISLAPFDSDARLISFS
jgi:hypothetical protein